MADLITLDTYKQAKAITGAKEDERLLFLIPAVSQLVKTYCGNSFVDYISTPYVEYITVEWYTNTVQLTETPLISVLSVAERLDLTSNAYTTLASTNYRVNPRTDTLVRLTEYWPVGIESMQVTYTAGYASNGAASLPHDLQLALVDLITYYLKDEYKSSKLLSGAAVTNKTTSSMVGGISFPDHIKRILDLYRYI